MDCSTSRVVLSMAKTLAWHPKGPMKRSELRRIMKSWPLIFSQASDPAVQSFALNMWERSSNPIWLPSLKQSQWMRELHREINDRNEVADLIEQ